MKKEPLILTIFRFLMGFSLLAFMAMLYWSSLLLEEKTLAIQAEINQLSNDIRDLKDSIGNPIGNQREAQNQASTQKNEESPYPNILQPDPFYLKTLPILLGPNFKPHGTFHTSTVGKPDNLHPFSNWADVSSWRGMCNVSVSKQRFGFYESYCPDMALRMEMRKIAGTEIPEFWIFLRKNVFWQPLSKSLFSENIQLAPQFLKKHPVTAHDFKFNFDAIMNPFNQEQGAVSLRTYLGDIESFKVIDDYTFVIRWKTEEVEENGKKVPKIKYSAKGLTAGLSPLASFLYKYFADGTKIVEEDSDPETYRTSSVWAQNFTQHWAKNIIPSCGPWIFKKFSESQISFKRNKDYFLPLEVLAEENETQFRDTTDAVWQDFKTNKIDTYILQADKVLELEQFMKSDLYQEQVSQGKAIHRLDYLSRLYYYIGWNQAKPYFKSQKLRQALTMAIDRKRIIREYLNGMGEEITGTFYKNSPSYDPSIVPLPFDVQKARRYLEEEGWYDSDGDGILDKVIDGKKVNFEFTLIYFVKNPISKSICEYVSTALKNIGIICKLNGVDMADLSATFEDKSFDAIQLGWSLGTPPEDPRQLWYSTGAKEKGSSNAVGFANEEVDKIIDQLTYEYDQKKRVELYHQFDKILYEEQPYTFLYSPKTALLYREYVQNVFIPADRQDLVPGANVTTPDSSIFWLKKP